MVVAVLVGGAAEGVFLTNLRLLNRRSCAMCCSHSLRGDVVIVGGVVVDGVVGGRIVEVVEGGFGVVGVGGGGGCWRRLENLCRRSGRSLSICSSRFWRGEVVGVVCLVVVGVGVVGVLELLGVEVLKKIFDRMVGRSDLHTTRATGL